MAKRSKPKPTQKSLWLAYCKAHPVKPCEVCGESAKGMVDRHHILDRYDFPQFLLEPSNIVHLCKGHHKWSKLCAEQNAIWFTDWLTEHKPTQADWVRKQIEKYVKNIEGTPEGNAEVNKNKERI